MENFFERIFKKDALIAGIGGDEFVVLMETDTRVYMEYTVLKIQEAVENLNKKHIYPIPIHLSMGYDLIVLGPDIKMHPSEFLKQIDEKMYKAKKQKKEI